MESRAMLEYPQESKRAALAEPLALWHEAVVAERNSTSDPRARTLLVSTSSYGETRIYGGFLSKASPHHIIVWGRESSGVPAVTRERMSGLPDRYGPYPARGGTDRMKPEHHDRPNGASQPKSREGRAVSGMGAALERQGRPCGTPQPARKPGLVAWPGWTPLLRRKTEGTDRAVMSRMGDRATPPKDQCDWPGSILAAPGNSIPSLMTGKV